jgi:tetratricopeptide (TPR) repeat protein
MNHAVLAMAYHRLRQPAEARQALGSAAEAIEKWTYDMSAREVGYLPVLWHDWLECQVYYREATLLIDGSPRPDDPRLQINRARALTALGKRDQAVAAYTQALASAEHHHGRDAKLLDQVSWAVVSRPTPDSELYRSALRLAEAAHRLEPLNMDLYNTVGVAQYRVGNYKEALLILTLCDRAFRLRTGTSHPADAALLAMTQHRLGHAEEARATLGRLREALKKEAWTHRDEVRGFVREAEELIEGRPAPPKP